jgi:regulator of sigma E protease
MQNLYDVAVAIGAFLVLIGLMVTVHEFGHFIVAKWCRVRVESFSLGFGPRLFGFKYGDTDYKVCLLPLGGYVAMTGESMPGENMKLEADSQEEIAAHQQDPGALTSHPRWQRMLIGVAGPIANFILAFVLMLIYYNFINEVPKGLVKETLVEWVVPGSPAAQAGIQPGDKILSFDNIQNPNWGQVDARIAVNANSTVALTVEHPVAQSVQSQQLSLHVPAYTRKNDNDIDLTFAGMLAESYAGPIGVFEVNPNTPAERAGLRSGDEIEAVDGLHIHSVATLLSYMQANPGKQLALSILRNGAALTLAAQPTILPGDTRYTLGFKPANPPFVKKPLPFAEAATQSAIFWRDNSSLIVDVLGRLFTRKVAVSQLSGPVGIARMAGQAAQMDGWLPKFGLAAAISLNLGILNLLPFPILDGGMIMLLLIEGVLRHDISLAVKERIYQAAFVVLVVFFSFIIFNDVTKLPIFTHFKP